MKKKNYYIFLVFVLFLGVGVLYIYKKKSYAERREYYPVQDNFKKDSILKIGIIGDSWVGRTDLDKKMQKIFSEKGIEAEFIALSHPGATSKEIYEDMFKEKNEEFSSKFVIESKPDYCIIIAGVNDVARHIGKKYYADHMILIINTLLHYKIKPIVVEVPNFGVEDVQKYKNVFSRYTNAISEAIDSDEVNDNNVSAYREVLFAELKINDLFDKIILFDSDKINKDYKNNKNLFTDPLHLNEQGYEVFIKALPEDIIDEIKRNNE